jgi:hypothetical protein
MLLTCCELSASHTAALPCSCFPCASPAQPPKQQHNNPSYYSHRATLAGEVVLLQRQLHTSILPADLWDWYMVRAGRSQASNSWETYVKNYSKAFGSRLPYLRGAGRSLLAVVFKPSLLSW